MRFSTSRVLPPRPPPHVAHPCHHHGNNDGEDGDKEAASLPVLPGAHRTPPPNRLSNASPCSKQTAAASPDERGLRRRTPTPNPVDLRRRPEIRRASATPATWPELAALWSTLAMATTIIQSKQIISSRELGSTVFKL